MAEVLNEGLPRAAWSIIADESSRTWAQRLNLSHTLLIVQSFLGLVMSLVFLGAAKPFANAFVPSEVRDKSITYVRITAFTALASAVEAAVATSTRSLDLPDVPLVMSTIKFALNILLDMLLISTFRIASFTPTPNTQAIIQLSCNLAAAAATVAYFLIISRSLTRTRNTRSESSSPSLSALMIMARPAAFTLLESAIRNALYLWMIHTVISLGTTYATAWGVFVTMRWGLLMVPTFALEATTLAFVGHAWGRWRFTGDEASLDRPRMTKRDLYQITRPAGISIAIALAIEIPSCIIFSIFAARNFAFFLSQNDEVAELTVHMWRTIDWCYIMYSVFVQLAAILLATRPKWYLWQSLGSNILYVLPWAIVCQVAALDKTNAWTYHAFIFGGSLVFSFIWVPIVLSVWAWTLVKGTQHLPPIRKMTSTT